MAAGRLVFRIPSGADNTRAGHHPYRTKDRCAHEPSSRTRCGTGHMDIGSCPCNLVQNTVPRWEHGHTHRRLHLTRTSANLDTRSLKSRGATVPTRTDTTLKPAATHPLLSVRTDTHEHMFQSRAISQHISSTAELQRRLSSPIESDGCVPSPPQA